MWINKQTKQIYRSLQDISKAFPDTGFAKNVSNDVLKEFEVYPITVEYNPTGVDLATHKLTQGEPVETVTQVDGVSEYSYTLPQVVVAYTADELTALAQTQASLKERSKVMARQQRDKLLLETDWTQLPDAPLSAPQKAVWATYRQALRDLPSQEAWPYITWPQKPE